MKRRILKADVTLVSLCKRGANGLATLFKGEGAKFSALVKASTNFDERGELLAVVAAPGLVDSDGDVFASPDVIRNSMHSFMRNGGKLDLQHDLKPLPATSAYVAESFEIRKGDVRFTDWKDYAGNSVDVSGGWGMLIRIEDEQLRKAYRNGDWDGISLYAPAADLKVLEKSDDDITNTMRSLFKQAGLIEDTETDMLSPEQLATLAKSIADGVIAGMKPVVTEPVAKGDAAPVFAGDPTSAADLSKHAAALERHALLKSGDLSDPVKVAALVKAAAEKAAAAEAAKDPKAARAELRKSNPALAEALDAKDAADERVKALEKGSNQPGTEIDEDEIDPSQNPLVKAGLIKADGVALMKGASAAAAGENKRRSKAYGRAVPAKAG